MAERDQLIFDTFVDLADTLTSDYDVREFLVMLVQRCAEILEVTMAGVMPETPDGHLRFAVVIEQAKGILCGDP